MYSWAFKAIHESHRELKNGCYKGPTHRRMRHTFDSTFMAPAGDESYTRVLKQFTHLGLICENSSPTYSR